MRDKLINAINNIDDEKLLRKLYLFTLTISQHK